MKKKLQVRAYNPININEGGRDVNLNFISNVILIILNRIFFELCDLFTTKKHLS